MLHFYNIRNFAMKNLKKIPIQIYLDPEQEKIIALLSKASGKSKAAIIRSCISKFIEGLPPDKDPALDIMAIGSSGKKDIAKGHDEYLISK
jgi:predicted DNA-binding protein